MSKLKLDRSPVNWLMMPSTVATIALLDHVNPLMRGETEMFMSFSLLYESYGKNEVLDSFIRALKCELVKKGMPASITKEDAWMDTWVWLAWGDWSEEVQRLIRGRARARRLHATPPNELPASLC